MKDQAALLFILGQARLFDPGGRITLESRAQSMKKSKATARKQTRFLVDQQFVEETSAKPLRFRLTPVGQQALGLDGDVATERR